MKLILVAALVTAALVGASFIPVDPCDLCPPPGDPAAPRYCFTCSR